jgi:hypothetical protein
MATGENGLVLVCFEELLCTLHGWSSSEENHDTLFLVYTIALWVRDSAFLNILVSTYFEVQILVENWGHFIISYKILSLQLP